MKTRGMIILIILNSILIHEVRGRTRNRRENYEESEEIEEEKGEEGEQYCACAAPAPAGTASLRHSFTDMPLLFEHVMALLQRDPAVLEQSNLMEASTVQKRDTIQGRSRRPTRREARNAPTPENFERLLSQVEKQLAQNDKNRSRKFKRKRESSVTMGIDKNSEVKKSHRGKGESKGNSEMKPKTKSNDRSGRDDEMHGPKVRIEKRSKDEEEDVGDYDKDLVKDRVQSEAQAPPSREDYSGQARANSGSTNRDKEEVHGSKSRIAKRSEDEEDDVGDSDKDLVKDQAHSGAREPSSREDSSGQARSNTGSTNRKREELHGPKGRRIVKRSEDEEEEDVGDEDTDSVKDQAHSGAQEPPSTEDNSGQARADSEGGGGQQLVMGTFQAMIMPMSGPAQVISGLMPTG